MKKLTYSMINSFLGCRRSYEYRYERKLVPAVCPTSLKFGSCVHRGLEMWFKYNIEDGALFAMECHAEKNNMDAAELAKAKALVGAYMDYWKDDEDLFEVEAVEYAFETKFRHPKTHRPSNIFKLCGKVDGLVRMKGKLFILEHKTTSMLDAAYIDRVLIDSQIAIYANAISQIMGEPVVGAIYDILVKPRTRFRLGETDEEFEARKAELLAKSKTGKTTAKKKEGETLDEFQDRCFAEISPDNFRRELVLFDPKDLKEHLFEIWDVGKELKKGIFYRNTGNCTKFGRPCPYLPLCRANGDVTQCEGLYVECDPNIELKEHDDD